MPKLSAAASDVQTRRVDQRRQCNPRRERAARITSVRLRQENQQQTAAPTVGATYAAVHSAFGGDPMNQSRLLDQYTRRLHRTAFAILRNKEDAEDAVQDALCRALVKLDTFQGRSAFSTWLTSIVKNSSLMTLRQKRARPESSLDELLDGQVESWTCTPVDARPNPEQICAANEIGTLVERRFSQLSSALRTALRLRVTNGRSTAELSQSLGISVAAFKSRICRARREFAGDLRLDQKYERRVRTCSGTRGRRSSWNRCNREGWGHIATRMGDEKPRRKE